MDNYDSGFGHALASYVVLVTIAIILVALRTFVKIKIVRNLGADDFTLMFALTCSIVSTAFFIRESYFAELFEMSIDVIIERLKSVYVCAITYNLAISFTKLSFLLQYLRIFHYKSMRIAIWTVFAIIVIYCGWAFFSSIFPCWPISSFWKISQARDYCVDAVTFYTAHAALNVLTDILTLLLPIPGLKRLMLPRHQKVGLILVFMLGGFTCVASSLRLVTFIRALDRIFYTDWASGSLGIWTSIEMNVAIICCCLPPLRPLTTRLWHRLQGNKHVKRSLTFSSATVSNLFSKSNFKKLFSSSSLSKQVSTSPETSEAKYSNGSSCGAGSTGSDNDKCNRDSPDSYKITSESIGCQTDAYGTHGRTVAAMPAGSWSSKIPYSPTASGTFSADFSSSQKDEKALDPHRYHRKSSHGRQLQDDGQRAVSRNSTSWLSITETIHDEHDDDDDVRGCSRAEIHEMYDTEALGSAV